MFISHERPSIIIIPTNRWPSAFRLHSCSHFLLSGNVLGWQRVHAYNLGSQLLSLARILLHEGESNNLTNGIVVREEHDESINAESPAPTGQSVKRVKEVRMTKMREKAAGKGRGGVNSPSRRQTMLKRLTKVFIDKSGFVIALCLLASLLLESKPLVERIVQFSIEIADLLGGHEDLATLTEPRCAAVVLGER